MKKVNDFELLKRQLDASMQKEEATLTGVHCGDNDFDALQGTPVQFVEGLQQQLDFLMEKNTETSESIKMPELADIQPQTDILIGEAVSSPVPSEKNTIADKLIVAGAVADQRPENTSRGDQTVQSEPDKAVSYSKFVVMAFVVCAAIAVLWYGWSTGFALPPQQSIKAAQPSVDKSPSLDPVQSMQSAAEKPQVQKELQQSVHQAEALTAVPVVALEKTLPAESKTEAIVAEQLTVAATIGNIRSAPDVAAKILFRLVKGTVVSKLSSQGEWYQVRLKNGTIAWAHHSIF